jgi:hypothetical protein
MQENKTVQVTITLEQAREWAGSSDKALREIAKKAFPYDELFPHLYYEKIQTMNDVVKYLHLNVDDYLEKIAMFRSLDDETLLNTYRIHLIAKAINGKDWIPSDIDAVYIPEIILETCTEESFDNIKKQYEPFYELVCISKDVNWELDCRSQCDFRYAVFMNHSRISGHSGGDRGYLTNEIYFETADKCDHAIKYFGKELFNFYKGTAPLK